MQAMRLSELLEHIPEAQLFGRDAAFERCSFDSREVQQGDLFIALHGERFDAHQFLPQVTAQGAVAAMVSKRSSLDISQICVPDTRVALGYLAQLNRQKFTGAVVALTGSAGKTTSKEMIAAVLREKGKVFATQGNFNNEIGVPKTLLELSAEYDFAVVEMGAAKQKDIAYLMQFVQPDIGVLLNALPAHIEGFHSLENVAKTKFEVITCLGDQRVGIINLDSDFAQQWLAAAAHRKIITYTLGTQQGAVEYSSENTVYAQHIKLSAWSSEFFLCYRNVRQHVLLNVPGEHNISNALAAAAVGIAVDLSLEQIAAGLSKFTAVAGRMAKYSGIRSSVLIDDSYNANPQAVKKALDVLQGMQTRKIFIMGDMAELGKQSAQLHADIGEYARGKIDEFWAVGELSRYACTAFGVQAKHFVSQQHLVEHAQREIVQQDIILVKGSRSSAMEKVVNALRQQQAEE